MEKANDRIGEWMEEKYNEEGKKKSETVGAAKPEGRKPGPAATGEPPVGLVGDRGRSQPDPEDEADPEKKRRREAEVEERTKKIKTEEQERQAAELKRVKEVADKEEIRKGEKRSGEDAGVQDREDNHRSPGASSSSTAAPDQQMMTPRVSGKHDLPMGIDEGESPEKSQKLSSFCFGIGSSDKKGEISEAEYREELKTMAEEYQSQVDQGSCFIHVRKRRSSNRDLKMLSSLTGGVKLYKVNLYCGAAEPILTNSADVAELLKEADCQTIEAVEARLEEEVKGKTWEADKRSFERRMEEEAKVRLDWRIGTGEKDAMACDALNALQSFPFAAWDDVSAAPPNPGKVVEARKLEMDYANKKPVWEDYQTPLDRH